VIGNHIYGNAMVDGKGPFQFVFDTGGVNLLTPTLAKQLGLAAKARSKALARAPAPCRGVTKVSDLQIGKASIVTRRSMSLAGESLSQRWRADAGMAATKLPPLRHAHRLREPDAELDRSKYFDPKTPARR